MISAGIDVSAKQLETVINRNGTSISTPITFENDAKGHQAILKVLQKRKVQRVCVEATGVYHLDLCVLLDGTGIELMVLNPKAAKQYADVMMKRSKTDGIDATLLAGYAQHMPFSPWKKPQACLRPRDRFWDIPVPKIDSAFDNLFVPQPSWSPSTTQQLRKLVAAPYLAPNDWTPRSEAYFVFPLAQGTPGKQCGLAATGVYQPSLRSPWLAANDAFLQVRACARRIEALTKQRTQAKNQLHALQATDTTPSFILEDVQLSITQADHQIDTLRKRTLQLIEANETMQQVLALLLSVKGIAEASAIQLMGELLVLPEDMKAKQWVAMAGLDPKHHQSGSSINKKARISKVGNRYLRQALYMPALSAARHDKHVNGYYRHLIEKRGLKKIQAICAVMRKLLHAVHAMLKQQKPFDNTRFFDLSGTIA